MLIKEVGLQIKNLRKEKLLSFGNNRDYDNEMYALTLVQRKCYFQ